MTNEKICDNIKKTNKNIEKTEAILVEEIKRRRQAAKISQFEMAKLLGVTQSAVSQWENGVVFPNTKLLPKIAKVLGCSIDEIMSTNHIYELRE